MEKRRREEDESAKGKQAREPGNKSAGFKTIAGRVAGNVTQSLTGHSVRAGGELNRVLKLQSHLVNDAVSVGIGWTSFVVSIAHARSFKINKKAVGAKQIINQITI